MSSVACGYDLVDVLALSSSRLVCGVLSLLSSADTNIGALTSTGELIAKKAWTVNDRDKQKKAAARGKLADSALDQAQNLFMWPLVSLAKACPK